MFADQTTDHITVGLLTSIGATFSTTRVLPSIFTPPSSCVSHWTYENEASNSIEGGLLLQNAEDSMESWDSSCFPPGFSGHGKMWNSQVFSPGACPHGYTIGLSVTHELAMNTMKGTETIAICCQKGFDLLGLYTLTTSDGIERVIISTACLSTFAKGSKTIVEAVSGGQTAIIGVVTMWAQPVDVKWQETDLVLFPGFPPTTKNVVVTSNLSAAARTLQVAPQTSQPASTSETSSRATSTSPSVPSTSSSSNSTGSHFLGIGVGVGIGAALFAVLLMSLIYWRRSASTRKRNIEGEENSPYAVKIVAELEGQPPPRELDDDRARCELETREEPQELGERKKNEPASPAELAGSPPPGDFQR